MCAQLREVQVVRYVAPFREGGSLPALSEADDGFMYVLKFSGAGQGTRALIADYLGGELARLAGLQVPELVWAQLSPSFGQSEPDEEIQDLLKASTGLNLGVHFLSGAMTYEPSVQPPPALVASQILWLDYLLTNVDRTPRNTNLLWWNRALWLIDHGASFVFHHQQMANAATAAEKPFALISQHVLLPYASELKEAETTLMARLAPDAVAEICQNIPLAWIEQMHEPETPQEIRNAYTLFLQRRLTLMPDFLPQIQAMHAAGI